MSIKKLFVILYSSLILGLLIVGGITIVMFNAQKDLSQSQEVRLKSNLAADELRQSSDDLTRLARTYVVTGDPKYEKMYLDILDIRNGKAPRPEGYEGIYWDFVAAGNEKPKPDGETKALLDIMKELGYTNKEFALIEESAKNSDNLVNLEKMAMDAVKGNISDEARALMLPGETNRDFAIRIMHDQTYHDYKGNIMKPIDEFLTLLDTRTAGTVKAFDDKNVLLLTVLFVFLGILLLLIAISITLTHKKVVVPVQKLTLNSESLAAGDMNFEIAIDSKDEMGILAQSFNQVKTNINGMLTEVDDLTRATLDGQLQVRGDVEKLKGEYANVITGFNHVLDAVVNPLNMVADYLERISKGDMPEKITDEYRGDFITIKNNLNICIAAIEALIADSIELSEQAVAGDLSARADEDRHSGDFAKIIRGFNDTLEAIVVPFNMTADYIDRISKGDIPEPVTDEYRGDFNTIKDNINTCIAAINRLITDVEEVIIATVLGYLNTRADLSKHQGDYRKIVNGINQTIETIVGHIDNINLPFIIVGNDMKLRFINKQAAKVAGIEQKGIESMHCNDLYVSNDGTPTENVAKKAMEQGENVRHQSTIQSNGEILYVAYSGTPIHDLSGEVVAALEVLQDLTTITKARFEIEQQMAVAEKQTNYQRNEVEKLIDAMAEMERGNLSIELEVAEADADTAAIRADFTKIDNSLKSAARNIKSYIDELSAMLEAMSEEKDLTGGIERSYIGDFIKLKNSVNHIINQFNDIFKNINRTAEQVDTISAQVASTSQELSQGATEQASSLEQMSVSIAGITEQSKQNSAYAKQANEMSLIAGEDAKKGNLEMKEMLNAMEAISESSKNISNVVKVIDDIAFQTNILALNAAVEAARAGMHGKGFAVVAEEVRRLAARSAAAVKDTREMIDTSILSVEAGSEIANKTAEALEKIVEGVTNAVEIVEKISGASEQQVTAISQVNLGIRQISNVTQANTATAEESAAVSEQMSTQAQILKSMIDEFKLK